MYVIKNSNGKYVGYPGRKSSYTRDISKARKFQNREQAQADCCGNERVLSVQEILS